MLTHRRAVESCFQAQSERLQTRLPAPRDWLVVLAVVGIMKPIMSALLFSQTRSYFLLSDMMVKLVDLYTELSEEELKLPDLAGTDDEHVPKFEEELLSLKRKMYSGIRSE